MHDTIRLYIAYKERGEMEKTCTFFGHRDCPESIRPKLRAVVTELIESRGVELFYVGQQGAFDAMVQAVLRELAGERPHIRYAVVLERMPGRRELWDRLDYTETMLPEGIETVNPRYAIDRLADRLDAAPGGLCGHLYHPPLGRRGPVRGKSPAPGQGRFQPGAKRLGQRRCLTGRFQRKEES